MMRQPVLGISAFYHDSAAALVDGNRIIAAAQEERFTRRKGDATFPSSAVAYCLRAAELTLQDVAAVAFYDKPLLKFERILESYVSVAPHGFVSFLRAGPLWIKEKLDTDKMLRRALGGYDGQLLYAEHHESHAASAFFPSPFEEAAILTMDGVGEWATACIGVGRQNDISLLRELRWPDSLGLLYSAFTYYTGFKVNSGEYKVMGLAPYGQPKYVDLIYEHLVDLREDGSFRLNQRYFNYLTGLTMTSAAFNELFGGPPRVPESNLTQREMDLARSVQVVCEDIMLRMARTAHRETGLENLVLAGGVALNCVGNGRLLREGPFKRIWIQPASGDAGGALGVAQLVAHRHLGHKRLRKRVTESLRVASEVHSAVGAWGSREGFSISGDAEAEGPDATVTIDSMEGAFLGPDFSAAEIARYLDSVGAVYRRLERDELIEEVSELLTHEHVIGWFNGRMEFGPRALGNRSIIGDPRSPRMQAQMNLKIKFREGFRPFAPSVLRERVGDYFELDCESPYMLLVAQVKSDRRIPMTTAQEALWGIDQLNVVRSDIPAITHVDYSARVQTVSRDTNPDYYDLIAAFERKTGCAVLVNTSFNVRGEPIVCSPHDAYVCFMRTHLDYLVIGSFLLDKAAQPEFKERSDWRAQFQLD